MTAPRQYRAGQSVEDHCRQCHEDRTHTVIVVDAHAQPLRVACDFCRSEHNYRGGPRSAPVRRQIRRSAQTRPAVTARRHRCQPVRSSAKENDRHPPMSHTPADNDLERTDSPHHPRGNRAHAGGAGGEVARRGTGAAARQTRRAGEELADRVVLQQGRDVEESPPHARTAGERLGPAGRSEAEDPGLHHRLLRLAHQLQRAVCE